MAVRVDSAEMLLAARQKKVSAAVVKSINGISVGAMPTPTKEKYERLLGRPELV